MTFLHDNKSESGDGGNFKKPTFQCAAAHIAHLCTNSRHTKDLKSCQNKWASVSDHCASISLLTISYSSRELIASSSPFNWYLDGIGMIRQVRASLLRALHPGTTTSNVILKPNPSATRVGFTSARSLKLCRINLQGRTFSIQPLPNLPIHLLHNPLMIFLLLILWPMTCSTPLP